MSSVAVVTGAARGLGRELATALHRRGHAVLLTDVDGPAVTAAAAALGGPAWALAQDVRDPDSHRAVATAAAARGPVAVWINNAGVLDVGAVGDVDEAAIRRMIDVNLLGVIWGARAALDVLAPDGHLLNIASLSSLVPAPGLAVYAASKHGVLGFTTSLAGELRQAGRALKVSAICPDVIATDMVARVADQAASDVLFSSATMLTSADVTRAVIATLDRPRLVRIVPAARAALVHALHPFPELGLRVLDQVARLGAWRKARRA
ncbi:MAG: SDR family NAD(P)-dependent oxidoreductase [Myxococcales bacterium]|nr:SDR family NAD(P)-dependent oxidoreductase [Myxococcales bacterium]